MKRFTVLLLLLCIPVFACTSLPVNASAAGEPAIYRVGYPNETDSLSPFIAESAYAADLFTLIYDPLIGVGDDLSPEGKIAESWEVSEDGLVWTFKLRQGIKWSDGTELTAKDVKYTYETYQKAELGYSSQMEMITAVEVIDAGTVRIVTEKPKANMLQINAPIIPKHVWEKIPTEELATYPNKNPIGTGAFTVVEWKEKDSLVLKANKDYFGGAPKIDQLIFILFANKDTMVQALKTGEIDAALNINPNQVDNLKNDPNIEVIEADERSFTELGFNCWESEESKGNRLLLDKRIRQAMEYAMDKEKLVSFSKMGAAYPGSSIIPLSQPEWHYNVPESDLRSYNPEKARKLLEDSGYKDTDGDGIREDSKGNKLSFRFAVISNYDHYVKSSQLMKTMFAEVGIEVTLETMDEGVLIDRMYNQNADFDLYIWGWTSNPDPSYIMSVMLTEEIGDMSDCFFGNKEFDQLYSQQLITVDQKARKEIIDKMQAILYEEAPYVIMYYNKAYEAYRTDKFTGFTRVPAENGPLFYFSQNNTSFVKLEPLKAETAAAAEAKPQGAEPARQGGGNTALYIIIAAVIVAVVVIISKRRSEKA